MGLDVQSFRKLRARRRTTLLVFWSFLVISGLLGIASLLAQDGWSRIDIVLLPLFALLLAQISFGFALAILGFWVLQRGGDPLAIDADSGSSIHTSILSATAVVM